MIYVMLILKSYSNYAGLMLDTIQVIINLAVMLAFCKCKTSKKDVQKSAGTDFYALIEQSGNYASWQVVLKFMQCFQLL